MFRKAWEKNTDDCLDLLMTDNNNETVDNLERFNADE